MPNVPFAITDGSLTFLGKRAMRRERWRGKKVEWKRLEERERRRGLDKTREGRSDKRRGRRKGSGTNGNYISV